MFVHVTVLLGFLIGLFACVAAPVAVTGQLGEVAKAPNLIAIQPTIAFKVGEEKDLLPFIRVQETGAVPFIPLTWAISNPALLSINAATGRAKGLGPGSAVVQVRAQGFPAGIAQLIIELVGNGPAVVKDVLVLPSSHHAAVGDFIVLQAQVFLPDGQINGNVGWASSDNTIATVNPTNGVVTALRPGRVTIIAGYAPYPEFKGVADIFVYQTRAEIPTSPDPVLPSIRPQNEPRPSSPPSGDGSRMPTPGATATAQPRVTPTQSPVVTAPPTTTPSQAPVATARPVVTSSQSPSPMVTALSHEEAPDPVDRRPLETRGG